MRKIAVMTVTLVLMLSFVGCTDKTISYNSNLGLDLNGIDYESVEFNVYHSNTQDHKWELLKTFSCSLKVGHFSDIRVEGEKNQVGIAFEDNRVERTENTVSYYGDDVDTYEFNIDGFNGWIGSFKVSAKYCYAAHESRLHQNDRCKRFALCLVLTVRFRSLAPWGKLFQLFI